MDYSLDRVIRATTPMLSNTPQMPTLSCERFDIFMEEHKKSGRLNNSLNKQTLFICNCLLTLFNHRHDSFVFGFSLLQGIHFPNFAAKIQHFFDIRKHACIFYKPMGI